MSQVNDLIAYLKKHGSITPKEAMYELKIWRLAARIPEAREKGYRIDSTMIKAASGKRHARYVFMGRKK